MTSPATPLTGANTLFARRVLARLIDDAVLVIVALGISMLVSSFVDEPSVIQLMNTFGEEPAPPPTSATALALVLLLMAIVVYYLAASTLGGRTPGRALAGLTVVRADGRAASTRLLLGRELLRVCLLGLAIGIAWPLNESFAVLIAEVESLDDLTRPLRALAPWLPVVVVAGLWIGATLVDPLERAPHDRVAGTRVVSATAGEGTER